MNFSTKPFIDEAIVQQRIHTLVNDVMNTDPDFSDGVTVVAATTSSIQFAKLFSAAFQCKGVECTVLSGAVDVTPKWLVENQRVWLNACLILQDVSSTGHHLKNLQDLCAEHLNIPVRTVMMLSKHQESETSWRPDWTGFCIPNEFVVGCGMDINGQLGTLGSIKVLA